MINWIQFPLSYRIIIIITHTLLNNILDITAQYIYDHEYLIMGYVHLHTPIDFSTYISDCGPHTLFDLTYYFIPLTGTIIIPPQQILEIRTVKSHQLALDYKKGGLITARQNELCDGVDDILSQAFTSTQVRKNH